MSKHTNNKTSFKSRLYDSLCRRKAGQLFFLPLTLRVSNKCLIVWIVKSTWGFTTTVYAQEFPWTLNWKGLFIIYISVKCALMLLYMMHLQHDSDIWTLLRGFTELCSQAIHQVFSFNFSPFQLNHFQILLLLFSFL